MDRRNPFLLPVVKVKLFVLEFQSSSHFPLRFGWSVPHGSRSTTSLGLPLVFPLFLRMEAQKPRLGCAQCSISTSNFWRLHVPPQCFSIGHPMTSLVISTTIRNKILRTSRSPGPTLLTFNAPPGSVVRSLAGSENR